MGCVLEVINLRLNRREALKLMKPELAAFPDAAKRFLHEARAAAGLESEHVVKVHHSGMLATGEPFITMAYLRGVDLESVLIESGALPVGTAVKYIREACAGLAEAHEKGLIHRDIKPSNLFLAERERGMRQIKVLDFGIAKAAEPTPGATVLTATGSFIGTPPYMSPEQLGADELDARADVWAIGAVFYELITGRRPFAGNGVAKLYANVMARPVEPPSTYAPDLPPAIEAIILRCLERDRSNRYANAGEIADALAPLLTMEQEVVVVGVAAAPAVVSNERTEQGRAPVVLAGSSVSPDATTIPADAPESASESLEKEPVEVPASDRVSPIVIEPVNASPVVEPGAPMVKAPPSVAPREERKPASRRNVILVAGMVVAGVLLGAALASQCGSSPAQPPAYPVALPSSTTSPPRPPITTVVVALPVDKPRVLSDAGPTDAGLTDGGRDGGSQPNPAQPRPPKPCAEFDNKTGDCIKR